MAKKKLSLREKLKHLIEGRRTISGALVDPIPIEGEYVALKPTNVHYRQVTITVENSKDEERIPGEVRLSIRDKDSEICLLYLDPNDALKIAELLFDPMKGA